MGRQIYVNLNDFLRPGEENAVRVLVRTGDMPNCRWYSGAGIYRDVYLMVGGLTHIARGGVRVSTLEQTDADALIAVDIPAVNLDRVGLPGRGRRGHPRLRLRGGGLRRPVPLPSRIHRGYRHHRLPAARLLLPGDRVRPKGAALGRFALSTAIEGTRGLHIDQEEGAALLYAPITLRDGAGVVFADERLTLTCELEGDARLLGFGSGDPKPRYNYIGHVTDTWNGRALAVLLPEKEHGQAVLRVTGGGLTAEETLRW